jgi:hypothetical protein
MTSTDTTATAAAAAPAAPNVFAQIEATLSADWANAVTFFQQGETAVGAFLSKVAAGAEVVIADIEAVGQYVAAHLGLITTGISALSTVAATVAPNNVTVAKAIADLSTSANDVAALSTALSTGSSAGDPAAVTTAVTAINAVKQLSGLVSQAGTTLTTLTANAPNATQTVSPATPAQG